MTPTREAQIRAIIERRKPLAKRIEQTQENLSTLRSALHALELLRNQIIEVSEPDITGHLQDINLLKLLASLTAEIEALDKLKRRFTRSTLNIGTVGLARQGKSQLLQSLSGLSSTEIPSGNGQHCTGARSIIYHNPTVSPYAEIWFYTERTFLEEVLLPYYLQLSLTPVPQTVDEFAIKPLPTLSPALLEQTTAEAKYKRLQLYKDHLADYRALLNAESPRRLSELREVRAYIAQDTSRGERVYFQYLAVREARIVCSFPDADVGQIALVDTIGLGDTGIGDEERIIKALGEDVDLALFVRLPKPLGDNWGPWDIKLHDVAYSALGRQLPLELWSFMILNQTDARSEQGDNSKNCRGLEDTIASVASIKVAQTLIVNCKDQAEVRGKLLDHVLDYLLNNIDKLDQAYAEACQERLISLHEAIASELMKASRILKNVSSGVKDLGEFEHHFGILMKKLTSGLERLIQQREMRRANPDATFSEYIKSAFQKSRQETGLPSLEEIEERRHLRGSYDIAYHEYLHEMRTLLTRHFIGLDDALKASVAQVKEEVSDVFREQGLLARLIPAKGDAFLAEMAALLPEEGSLQTAFQILSSFKLSYRGFVQHRIRKNLDSMIPDKTTLKLSVSEPSAQEVRDCLQVIQKETVFALEKPLREWSYEPAEALFAIVEEFKDQILRAEGVERQWRLFYYEMRG